MKDLKKLLVMILALCMVFTFTVLATGCGGSDEPTPAEEPAAEEPAEEPVDDAAAAAAVDEMIAAIQVQEWSEENDANCEAAKAAWDALTDEQKALVEEGGYFADDTGDASADDPLNQDEIGENELLVVSFGTSFNDSRVATIKAVEDKIQAAFPDWSVRRAFTAQIIINHIYARDGEKIDNIYQALDRAVANGVKNLVIQPTHLMHGAEYDELMEAVGAVEDKFESVKVAEPLLGEVGESGEITNADKKEVCQAVVADMAKVAGFKNRLAAEKAGTAFVLMGHGTSHDAKITYTQMASQMKALGYSNVFIGTVEGEPEETAVENVIAEVHKAGFKKVILRPLMLVAGDHATNDMAGDEDDSWKSLFNASGYFDGVDCQILGLGQVPAIQKIYVAHTAKAVKDSKKKLK